MKKNILFTIGLLISLCSCISTESIVINMQQPATVTLPPEIVNLTIVDNAAVRTLNHAPEMADKEVEFVPYDSVKISFVKNLLNKIAEKEFFGDVQVYPYEIRTDTAYFEEKILEQEQISAISDTTNADGLLTLDNFAVSSSSELINGYKEIALCIQAKLRLFSPNGALLSSPMYLNDTLYWSEVDYSYEFPIIKELPTLRDALSEINDHASNLIIRQFVPYWISATRTYFPDKITKKMIEENKWDSARGVWMSAFDGEQETKRMKRGRLAYNIALAYECVDNIEEANNWINKACMILPNSISGNMAQLFADYKISLAKRLQNKEILKKQLGV